MPALVCPARTRPSHAPITATVTSATARPATTMGRDVTSLLHPRRERPPSVIATCSHYPGSPTGQQTSGRRSDQEQGLPDDVARLDRGVGAGGPLERGMSARSPA